MLRLTASLLAITALVAFAAPLRASAQEQGPCFAYDEANAVAVLEAAPEVIVGRVVDARAGHSATIQPEFYLKGATSPDQLVLVADDGLPCSPADLPEGQRVLLILGQRDGTLMWPGHMQAFALHAEQAYRLDAPDIAVASEAELVERMRHITGQYSVPAASEAEGASLDWMGTVLPVTGAVLIVFAIGLVLMREWHRIDPT